MCRRRPFSLGHNSSDKGLVAPRAAVGARRVWLSRMAKAKKITKVVAVRRPRDPEHDARVRRALVHLVCAIVFIALCGTGLFFDRRYVEHKLVFTKQPP